MPPSTIPITALADLRVSRHQIPAHGHLPNTSIQSHPLLIYHSCFHSRTSSSPNDSAGAIESHLTAVGVVQPQWRYTMYSTTHFHSNTHEVLCVSRGRARLCFGGEDNPGRVEAVVDVGDVMVLPGGLAHRLLEDIDGGFQMVGSYPPSNSSSRSGGDWDMCYGREGEDRTAIDASISELEWFKRDPIYGDQGPVLQEGQTIPEKKP